MSSGMKRGRPCKPAHEKRNSPLNFRMTGKMREALQLEATLLGRSLASVVTRRLEESLAEPDPMDAILAELRERVAGSTLLRRH